MDLNRLINMFVRMFVNKGINKGITYAANRGKDPKTMTPKNASRPNPRGKMPSVRVRRSGLYGRSGGSRPRA